MLAGAVLAPVVPSYGPRELGFILRESRARLLVTPDRLGRRDYLVDLQRIGDCPDLLSVAVIADSVPSSYFEPRIDCFPWCRSHPKRQPIARHHGTAPEDLDKSWSADCTHAVL